MLNWANQFNICCFLDNHGYDFAPHSVECLLALDPAREVSSSSGNAFAELTSAYYASPDWMFGHFSFDLKQETEGVVSTLPDNIGFPDLYFFVPKILIRLSITEIHIASDEIDVQIIFDQILNTNLSPKKQVSTAIDIKRRFDREEYIQVIEKLRQHILRGDCYEINFCQEFYAENIELSPIDIYHSLSQQSPNPFSGFYRLNNQYLICASPERYLKKDGTQLLSQPMKGTSRRDRENGDKDSLARAQLAESAKDRSENVMVVDLVRNDLSRVCEEGSVKVDELFGVYSFPLVHQMVSTVSGTAKNNLKWPEIIRATFPMGSMTGAPKRRVLELIEQYERSKRGIFSGALGYVTPEADFDFNVVIRSILYNRDLKYLSFLAGSGITFYSDPAQEYEECLIKVQAIGEVLAGSSSIGFSE